MVLRVSARAVDDEMPEPSAYFTIARCADRAVRGAGRMP
jgi:hypothetical protein